MVRGRPSDGAIPSPSDLDGELIRDLEHGLITSLVLDVPRLGGRNRSDWQANVSASACDGEIYVGVDKDRGFSATELLRWTRHAATGSFDVRYGFAYEGTLRQHMIAKGRNRDTAYFSMLDSEWPARRDAFERWLAPENFDNDGRQKLSLSALNGQKALIASS